MNSPSASLNKMEIGQASIIKFNKKGKILIHSLSRTDLGSVATEPFIWLEITAPVEEITKQTLQALNSSKSGLKAPKDWDMQLKDFLKKIGLTKEDELYDGVIYVEALKKDQMITFTPMINMGKRKGVVNVPKLQFKIEANKSTDEISVALQNALDKSE